MKHSGSGIGRRAFVKIVALGAGIAALAATGASLFKITGPSGSSNLSADESSGHDILTGTLANRPSAGEKDRIYHATDGNGIYYDDGSNWKQVDASV